MSQALANDQKKRLRRIAVVSQCMKWFMTIFMALVVIVGVLAFLALTMPEMLETSDEVLDFGNSKRTYGELPAVQRWSLAIFTNLSVITFLIVLFYMRRVFACFQSNDFFSSRTLDSLISCGLWFVVFGISDLLEEPVQSILTTMDLEEGQRQLEVAFEGGEIFLVVFGILFIIFGWVMREAARLHEENQQFV